MKPLLRNSLLGLQWSLGLVVFIEAALLAFVAVHIHEFAMSGLPGILRIALAWGEMIGAVLLLIPRTSGAGGKLLVVIFVAAFVLHVLHGWLDVGNLVVYAAAAMVLIAFYADHS
ncbi:MAG: hypothetical protein WB421_10580 [Terriglobales bacterium]